MSPGLMGQREFWRFSLFMPALLLAALFSSSSLNHPPIRPFALAACNGFIRRYYQEGPVLPRLHPDGHKGEERRREERKKLPGEEVDQTGEEETHEVIQQQRSEEEECCLKYIFYHLCLQRDTFMF